jgi:hypothetical protein
MDRVIVKLEQDLAYEVDHIICRLCWCMCCIDIGGDGMECAKQRYISREFHFIGHRCVEKFITGFKIDGCTIKRGKLVCISVI